MRTVIDIADEPIGERWRSLARELARHAARIQLVVRDGDALQLGAAGTALLARLEPRLVEQARRSSWPGTLLSDHAATVLLYSLGALDDILDAADRLYAWRQPELPEDLALLRADGTPLLASVTHERDAWLELTDAELAAVRDLVTRR